MNFLSLFFSQAFVPAKICKEEFVMVLSLHTKGFFLSLSLSLSISLSFSLSPLREFCSRLLEFEMSSRIQTQFDLYKFYSFVVKIFDNSMTHAC